MDITIKLFCMCETGGDQKGVLSGCQINVASHELQAATHAGRHFFFCLIQLVVLKKKSGIFICFLFKGGISEMMAFSTNVKKIWLFYG